MLAEKAWCSAATSAPDAAARPLLLIPREHGAWAMLLLPFISAAILARAWTVSILPALLAAVAVFLLREPLVVLLRQRYVWKNIRPEAAAARRSLWAFGPALALSGFWLLVRLPGEWTLILAGGAFVLTGVYAVGALANHQRSPALQVAGALGLSASAMLAYLAALRPPDAQILYLWTAHAAHSAGSVLVVHARLEAVTAFRAGRRLRRKRSAAVAWQLCQAALVALYATMGQHLLAIALALPLTVHIADLAQLGRPEFLRVPLRLVGVRELALGVTFSILVLAALW